MDLFGRGRILLNDVKVLVIDEADRMLDMGFIPDVEHIVSLLPKIRQTLFFSATMAPEIRRLADAFLMNPKEVSIDSQASAAVTVDQFLVVCQELDKREALRHLIRQEDVKNALIFCNRKRDVDILCRSLVKHGFDAVQLHGDMAQASRTETLERFKTGAVRLMVCSDVAARGLDISDLSHVFNFDVPHHAEDYIHRIGRTGRAGKLGRSFTIATPDDGKFLGAITHLIGKEIPRTPIEGLPELTLDMQGGGRRRGSGSTSGSGSSRKREERSPRGKDRERSPRRTPEAPAPIPAGPTAASPMPASPIPTNLAAPEDAALPVREVERDQRGPRPNRPADRDWANRSRNERPKSSDGDHARGDRNRGDRGRNDRGGRYRDDHGIGEMNHPDNVVGFGDALPDFLVRPVPLPNVPEKAASPVKADAPAKKATPARKAAAAKAPAAGETPETVEKKKPVRKRRPAKAPIAAAEQADQTPVEPPVTDKDA
jgi:superfamily II DNA/RNA helicase